MEETINRLRIPESKLRVVLALITPPLMLGMALLTLTVEAPIAVPVVFGILGTLLAIVVVFDFPLAFDLSQHGLVRVCLVRRHALEWSEIAAIVKPRRRGLVLVTTNRKRHVLVDRILEEDERKALMDFGEAHGVQVEF
jgi:hypothetical protein